MNFFSFISSFSIGERINAFMKTIFDKFMNSNFMNSKYSEVLSISFILPLIIWLIIYFIGPIKLSNSDLLNFYGTYSTTFLGASASIFGISLAALSVFISVLYRPAVPKMIENNLLDVFLFPFLINIILWGMVAMMSIFTLFATFNSTIEAILTTKLIFFNFYIYILFVSILYTIELAIHVIKTAIISLSGE